MKKIFLMFMMLIFVFSTSEVKATSKFIDGYYTNNFGIKITEKQYNFFKENGVEDVVIRNLNKETFDILLDNPKGIEKVEVAKEVVGKENNVLSKGNCNSGVGGTGCYKTASKELYFLVYDIPASKSYMIVLYNNWLKTPATRSYDVLGARWTSGNFSVSNWVGLQDTDIQFVQYSPGGTNSKQTSTGIGVSMNLIDNANVISNELTIYGSFSKKQSFTMYGTYQHAISNISLAESKSYSFASDGLGGVLKFSNSTIANKFDKMPGVYYTFTPKYIK